MRILTKVPVLKNYLPVILCWIPTEVVHLPKIMHFQHNAQNVIFLISLGNWNIKSGRVRSWIYLVPMNSRSSNDLVGEFAFGKNKKTTALLMAHLVGENDFGRNVRFFLRVFKRYVTKNVFLRKNAHDLSY